MKKVLMIISVFTVSLSSMTSANLWDLNTDMDTTIGDNGIWSYGYGVGDPNDPNVVPTYQGMLVPLGEVPGVWIIGLTPAHPGNYNPHLWYGASNVGTPVDWHGARPGWQIFGPETEDTPAAEAPILFRWTAPDSLVASNVNFNASFIPSLLGTVQIYIVKSVGGDPEQRTILLNQKDITPENPLEGFLGTCDINVGDTIDFMIGPQGPEDLLDWTSVSITIGVGCTSLLPMDFNGDCYVNLEDFAIFAQSWLDCNHLNDPTCED